MRRPQSTTSKFIIIFLIVTTILINLLPSNKALANSAPPPTIVWLTLENQTDRSPRLLGIQLIGCATDQCEQPVLLQQHGVCNHVDCLSSTPTLSGWSTSFECAQGICRSSAYPDHGGMGFRIVVQFSDGVRSSGVIDRLPSKFGEVAAWRIAIRESDLSITQDATIPAFKNPSQLMRQNLGWISLSIVVELFVAALCFQRWAKTDIRQLSSRLSIVLLVNLASLPVVWLFFPSLGHFQLGGSRDWGMFILILAGLFSGLLIAMYRSTGKARGWAIALAIIAIILAVFIYGFMRGMIWYSGAYTMNVQGLSSTVIIAISEVFAVVYEGLMLAVLTKSPLSARFIWLTSLLMNASSFLIGLLLASY